MKKIMFPYGKEKLEYEFNENELAGVLTSKIEEYVPEYDQATLIKNAIESPVNSERLCDLARDKKNVVIIASDHTRPVPSKFIIPPMLEEIRKYNPDANITILIATGCHRETTKEELVSKFGEDIVNNENIYIHDCDEEENLVNIGKLPSGGNCFINSIAIEADLLLAEGFIEPHLFAGFSGGRKSVLPGVAGRETVLANHCSEFIANENSRTGILESNPIHKDMLWAAKQAKLTYIVNVVLNAEKEIIYAVAGELEAAHKKGTDFLYDLCGAKAIDADIAITTNGGYPLDQNVYQAIKGMTAAEATVKEGGVIIMLASSDDGTGGDHLYHQLADEPELSKTMDLFMKRNREETATDQWMAQILVRILMKATVVYVSKLPDKLIEDFHMIPAHSIDEAITKAKQLINKDDLKIVAIPDGISVMVTK